VASAATQSLAIITENPFATPSPGVSKTAASTASHAAMATTRTVIAISAYRAGRVIFASGASRCCSTPGLLCKASTLGLQA
jgi:hypothetical protein